LRSSGPHRFPPHVGVGAAAQGPEQRGIDGAQTFQRPESADLPGRSIGEPVRRARVAFTIRWQASGGCHLDQAGQFPGLSLRDLVQGRVPFPFVAAGEMLQQISVAGFGDIGILALRLAFVADAPDAAMRLVAIGWFRGTSLCEMILLYQSTT
jgi:hypothetical protein